MRPTLIVLLTVVLSGVWTPMAYAAEEHWQPRRRPVHSRPVSPIGRRFMEPLKPRPVTPLGNWLALADLDKGSTVRVRTLGGDARSGRLLHVSSDAVTLDDDSNGVTITRDAVAKVELIRDAPRQPTPRKSRSVLRSVLGIALSLALSYGLARLLYPMLSRGAALALSTGSMAINALEGALHSPPRLIYVAR